MWSSLASYMDAPARAVREVYPISLYLNSPAWPPEAVTCFLSGVPEIDLIGVDGVCDPHEPNGECVLAIPEDEYAFAAGCRSTWAKVLHGQLLAGDGSLPVTRDGKGAHLHIT